MPSGSLLGPKGAKLIGDLLAGGSVVTVPRHRYGHEPYEPALWDVVVRNVREEQSRPPVPHLFVYVGFSPSVFFDEVSVQPYRSDMPIGEDGWLDAGGYSSNVTSVSLCLVATQAQILSHGDAVWRVSGKWCVALNHGHPQGWTPSVAYDRELFTLDDLGWHKLCGSPIQFSSRPTDTQNTNAPNGEHRSIAVAYHDPVLQIYGFDIPTIVANPWASDTPPTGIENNDWLLMLRRVTSDGIVEVQYMPLAQVAGSPNEDGYPEGPELPDVIKKLMDAPCEDLVNHETLYAWNPCTNEWVNLAKSNGAQGHDSVFWRTGGDEETCKGSAIGNENGAEVIHLGGRAGGEPSLKGPVWNCDGAFNCAGSVNSTIGFYAGNTAAVTPGIVWARDNVQTNIVNCNRIEIGGVFFAPKQITYIGDDGRPHTETVLAAQ